MSILLVGLHVKVCDLLAQASAGGYARVVFSSEDEPSAKTSCVDARSYDSVVILLNFNSALRSDLVVLRIVDKNLQISLVALPGYEMIPCNVLNSSILKVDLPVLL